MRPNRGLQKIALGGLCSLVLLWAGTSLGSAPVSPVDTLKAFLEKALGISAGAEDRIVSIVWNLRFPRALLAFMIGGALSVSGGVFQSTLRNPLASPYILGVSSGASLGAGIIMLTGFSLPFAGDFTLPAAGFVFGLLTVFLVIWAASRLDRGMSNHTVILFGMVFSLFVNAILTTLTSLYREELRNLLHWQMGSFSLKSWSYLVLMLPFLGAGTAVIFRYHREMDILTFDEDDARALGVDAGKTRKILLASSAALTGAAVALCGAIGFVDLIAPHLARRITGSRHCFVLPMAFLIGGSLMVLADLIARTLVSPTELPVGAVTALIGGPFFAWVYFKKR